MLAQIRVSLSISVTVEYSFVSVSQDLLHQYVTERLESCFQSSGITTILQQIYYYISHFQLG